MALPEYEIKVDGRAATVTVLSRYKDNGHTSREGWNLTRERMAFMSAPSVGEGKLHE
ncbi:hypothetical protein [Cupriavidus basilensis]|uniref:hypothetical protein n=1 Tax=Cupriavidus basilensis TaxID=68895 RepID=UPI0023E7DEF3|nr:hypothetical protein [Cupriavidus basilensis]MDF3884622.1 hypothetical protein [Cupriavidus basilensis]